MEVVLSQEKIQVKSTDRRLTLRDGSQDPSSTRTCASDALFSWRTASDSHIRFPCTLIRTEPENTATKIWFELSTPTSIFDQVCSHENWNSAALFSDKPQHPVTLDATKPTSNGKFQNNSPQKVSKILYLLRIRVNFSNSLAVICSSSG